MSQSKRQRLAESSHVGVHFAIEIFVEVFDDATEGSLEDDEQTQVSRACDAEDLHEEAVAVGRVGERALDRQYFLDLLMIFRQPPFEAEDRRTALFRQQQSLVRFVGPDGLQSRVPEVDDSKHATAIASFEDEERADDCES